MSMMKPFILCLFLGMLLISAAAIDQPSKDETRVGSATQESKTTEGWGGGGGPGGSGGGGPGGWGGGGHGGGGWGGGGGHGGGGWGGGGGHGGCQNRCCKYGRCWCC